MALPSRQASDTLSQNDWQTVDTFLERNGDRLLDIATRQNAFFSRQSLLETMEVFGDAWEPKTAAKALKDSKAMREAAADTLLSDLTRVVELDADARPLGDKDPEARFTTVELQTMDLQIVRSARRMAQAKTRPIDPAKMHAALTERAAKRQAAGKDPKIDEELRGATDYLSTEGRLKIVIGPPGAGKTTLIELIGNAIKQSGGDVLVTTQSGTLTQKLFGETGHHAVPLAEVVQRLRTARRAEDAQGLGLKAGSTIVVDEAAMLNTRQMFDLMQAANRLDLNLNLIGDPKQLDAMGPGAPLRKLLDYVPYKFMNRVIRQKDEADNQATRDLYAGHPKRALKSYAKRGKLTFETDFKAAVQATAADYVAHKTDPKKGSKSSMMLAQDFEAATALNAKAREGLKAAGQLTDEISLKTAFGERGFATGDRIIIRENAEVTAAGSAETAYKGTLATVTGTARDALTIRLDEAEQDVSLKLKEGIRLDHAHALELVQPDPDESPQGTSLHSVFLAVTKPINEPEILVAISRHQKNLIIRTDSTLYPDVNALAKAAHQRPEKNTTLDYIDRPSVKR